ncbi:ABC transporter substrate-binding protein [Desnuesiella massiliensis]|uniref:ABC transporter substrate-binding protein n=1 Tax=Desnuesiella massiliensis TaxID=1650662 RepID=UPI0006E2A72C|nr:ABC transporter substrate-binding protein [Desnuesiella massiliensis]
MVGKNKSSIIISLILILSLFGGCSKGVNSGQTSSKKVKIGISQIAEHPALDLSQKGFIEGLKSKGLKEGENFEIEVQNAQGDIANAQLIANNFVSQKKDMIFAIATPAAQAAYNATKDIPILITAVTDPVKAGIVKSMDKSETNVTGTSDAIPMDKQLALAKEILPKVKKVGVLYNTGEINSEIQLSKLKELSSKFDLEVLSVGVNNVNDVAQALDSILGKIDMLYVLTDNLAASSMPLIASKSIEKKVPVIGSEEAHVKAGALVTDGIDYFKLGFQTGQMAYEIIQGKEVKSMPIETLKETKIVINLNTAKKLGIDIPDTIVKKAEAVKEGN